MGACCKCNHNNIRRVKPITVIKVTSPKPPNPANQTIIVNQQKQEFKQEECIIQSAPENNSVAASNDRHINRALITPITTITTSSTSPRSNQAAWTASTSPTSAQLVLRTILSSPRLRQSLPQPPTPSSKYKGVMQLAMTSAMDFAANQGESAEVSAFSRMLLR